MNGKTCQFSWARSSSVGRTAKRTPPCTTPQRLPAPPTTVMSRNVIDRLRPKSSFDTICSIEANSAAGHAGDAAGDHEGEELVAGDVDAPRGRDPLVVAQRLDGPAGPGRR